MSTNLNNNMNNSPSNQNVDYNNSTNQNMDYNNSMDHTNSKETEILQELENLKLQCQNIQSRLTYLENSHQNFNLFFNRFNMITSELIHHKFPDTNPVRTQQMHNEYQIMEQQMNQKMLALKSYCDQLAQSLQELCTQIRSTLSKVIDGELYNWKREQQRHGNGAKINLSLDTIQTHCEILAEVIWDTKKNIDKGKREKQLIENYTNPEIAQNQCSGTSTDVFDYLHEHITEDLTQLVQSTFIIEVQPPQVIKTYVKFSTTVKLLTGMKLNVHMTPPMVKVQVINRDQADLISTNQIKDIVKSNGSIDNDTGTMECRGSTLSVIFKNLQVKTRNKGDNKPIGTDSVMDNKYCLYFTSQFTVGGGEFVFKVKTLSLPVVIIVHNDQDCKAQSTILWDNGFSELGRSLHHTSDKRAWSLVAEVLKMKFESVVEGGILNGDCLKFLAEKALRSQSVDHNNELLSWAMFAKDNLPERDFTFWRWFYEILKLTRDYLKPLWSDGLIIGFIRKEKAQELLKNQPLGTFLLRFSDSELGGISIAWLQDKEVVLMVEPFTREHLQMRNLADRLNDLEALKYLYPNRPKHSVFEKYYSPPQDKKVNKKGYVSTNLVTTIPGYESTSLNTINHYCPISPPESTDTSSNPYYYQEQLLPTMGNPTLDEDFSQFNIESFIENFTLLQDQDDSMNYPATIINFNRNM